ncbi:hypothetical protein RvY_06928 [Ramazzottius varieornatus]|uniref:receptor protein serine/threonine kinase n=1 Tax=Ramazzottius varieornatus TaxID=947166 RepID=A0A1D1V5I6_RAMVA|nr:hypothetical protein RvY_06928 [Ramazzottius varieornatus]
MSRLRIFCVFALFLIHLRTGSALECFCEENGCAEWHVNNTCHAAAGGKCYATIREQLDEKTNLLVQHYEYGCLPGDTGAILQCRGNLPRQVHFRFQILCCNDKDHCNFDLEPTLPPTTAVPTTHESTTEKPKETPPWVHGVIGLMALCAVSLFVGLGCGCYWRKKGRRTAFMKALEHQSLTSKLLKSAGLDKEEQDDQHIEQSMTSGSGSGFPLLVQTTVARQLHFIKNIGKGRYGEVWKARFRDQDVAVKIFSTLDEVSWQTEMDLYGTQMLRHENILGFVASDIGGTGSCTQMLLITDFHYGALFDYLRESQTPLPGWTMLSMAHSIANGLSHLHAQISGTAVKPAIVHRDMKSKNILVKADHSGKAGVVCVIADFGLAIREDAMKSLDTDKRQGTRRYMAPELLDFTIKKNNFEALKQSDIYSFSLIMWELARCTDLSGQREGYDLPYGPDVGNDPSFDDMRQVVCNQRKRPTIAPYWNQHEILAKYVSMMVECWNPNPSGRRTALSVKKGLARLQEQLLIP